MAGEPKKPLNIELILSWVYQGCKDNNAAMQLLATLTDDPVDAVTKVGPIITNALLLKHRNSTLSMDPVAVSRVIKTPKKTQLCRLTSGNLPDILCSTDGKRHDYGIYEYPRDVETYALNLLPREFEKKYHGDPSTECPKHLGQYTFIKILQINAKNSRVVFVTRLGYQLLAQQPYAYGAYEVPETSDTNCVVPKAKVYFPILFRSKCRVNKFSFTPSQKKEQAVYQITKSFLLLHPKSPMASAESCRLSFDKKSVFLDKDTILQNLALFAKTTPVT